MADPKEIPINLPDPEILDEFRYIVNRRNSGSLKPKGADAKIKERIGERNALQRIKRKFPGSNIVVVPTRRNGVPVLDLLMEAPDGKFIIVEAKFNTRGDLKLGKTNSKSFLVDGENIIPIKVKGGTQQMSPRWIEDRIRELKRLGKRDKEIRILAGRLEQSLHKGSFEAHSVVSDSTGEYILEKNHTQEWKDTFTTKKTHQEGTKQLENHGVTEESRGRDEKKRKAKKRKRMRKRQQAAKRTARREKAAASQKRPKPKIKKSLGKAGNLKTPNIRPKGAKFLDKAGKVKLGFGAKLLIDISIDLMLSMLESRLDDYNQEGIEREFSDRVYEKILKKRIDLTVFQAKNGLLQEKVQLRNTPAYIRYRYTILMERQAETLSDATIFVVRLLLMQGADFYEVYLDLIADPNIEWQIGTPKKLVVRQRRKKTEDEDIFAYKYVQHILVWDPTIFKLYQAILEQTAELIIKSKEAFDKAWMRKPDNWFFSVQSELGELLKKYQFQSSINLLNDTNRVPKNRSDEFDDLKSALRTADGYLGAVSLLSEQHQALLAMYLNKDPFTGRRKALNREAKRKAAERIKKLKNQKWTPPPPGSGGRMW